MTQRTGSRYTRAMKVCIDGIAFENAHQRGVQRYHRELIERYPASVHVELLLGETPRCALPSKGTRTFVVPSIVRSIPRKWRRSLSRPLSQAARARAEGRANVFHSSYFTLPRTSIPTVITVYDMIVERFIEFSGSTWATEEVRRKRAAILGADLIVAISKATADEIVAFYPATAGRIVPILLGADHLPLRDIEAGAEPGGPALYVGDRGGYKNFRVILEAMACREWPSQLSLTVVGPEPNESEKLLVSRMAGAGRVCFVGRVDESALGRLYRESSLTIVPSLVEGFGFPIVEAQRSGSPVACSDIPVFREVAGDTAAYFNPTRPDSLAAAAAHVMQPAFAERLRTAGRANSASFTWARCVEQTVDAYERAIELHRLRPTPVRV